MSKKATEEALDGLHGELAKQLAKRIKAGEATAADFSVARQFLRDNGISATQKKGNPLDALANTLPFGPEDEDEGAFQH